MKCLIVKEGASWHSSRITSDKRNKRFSACLTTVCSREQDRIVVFFAAVQCQSFLLAYYGHVNHDKKLSPLPKLTSFIIQWYQTCCLAIKNQCMTQFQNDFFKVQKNIDFGTFYYNLAILVVSQLQQLMVFKHLLWLVLQGIQSTRSQWSIR